MDQDKFDKATMFLYAACNELKEQIQDLKKQAENVIDETRKAREEEQANFEKWYQGFITRAKKDAEAFDKKSKQQQFRLWQIAVIVGLLSSFVVLFFFVLARNYSPDMLRW